MSASISGGQLVLRTWRVADDGLFTPLDVENYALGHRQIVITPTTKRFQLVTPIARAGGMLRFVTWEIDGLTGVITAREDTGDLPVAMAPDPQLTIAYVPGTLKVQPHYATSFLTGGTIANMLWFVTDLGHPEKRGAMASGRDIDNLAPVSLSASSLAARGERLRHRRQLGVAGGGHRRAPGLGRPGLPLRIARSSRPTSAATAAPPEAPRPTSVSRPSPTCMR